MQQSTRHPRLFSVGLPTPFTRRLARSNPADDADVESGGADESPKTPRFNLRRPNTYLPFSQFLRSRVHESSTDSATAPVYSATRPPRNHDAPNATVPGSGILPVPEPVAASSVGRVASLSSEEPPNSTHDRRRTRRRLVRAAEQGQGGATNHPKRFLFCLPRVASRRVQSMILQCFISGLFMTLLLSVYLALQFTGRIRTSEFTVLLVMTIIFSAIFFCYALFRLFTLVARPESRDGNRSRSRGGFVPAQPIRVVLARDHEDLEGQTDNPMTRVKPPPYGAWRQSVRIDPNRFFWQRNPDIQGGDTSQLSPENRNGYRPPSYASDDGVSYVVDARPRSMAPTAVMDIPLPVHQPEAGRTNGRPAP
ncbi:hypothetical protein SODALDRAFT_322176 [Sodiomyces alkalinus F11]|uniref:Uncharacterized protein n=1 Tax=Sodiomyces alkalinus (strain CBS 110278 / VKM F-3762 / F11) TaxID=1314773 RepID=A0A3N2Q2G8_SODAK|nr:hypothetical protein SODALDRAFT_322176 [Sodiomyces alkalinus F11]ROT40916.1 hypothetical protein SODALDRAFT_322176 [Sodiomyces alkalinus F11]